MKLTVLLAVSLGVVAVSDVNGKNENGDCVGLCESEHPGSGRRHLKYGRRWSYFVYPRHPYLVGPYRRLEIPSSCKNIECPKSEVCRLIRPQCFFDVLCRPVPICARQDKSGAWVDTKESNNTANRTTNNKQPKGSPSASSEPEDPTVPSDQTPVLIEGLWKGGEPHSVDPEGPEIPAKSWKVSALNDTFGAGPWFGIRHQSGEKVDDVGGKAKKRVHRDK